jgi:hypothetical protein
MKRIILTAAAIAIGVGGGLAAPWIAKHVHFESKFSILSHSVTVAGHRDAPAAMSERPATDPNGLVGAAERLPSAHRPPQPPAASRPLPPAKPTVKVERTRHGAATRTPAPPARLDCREYIPKAQQTIRVPCAGQKPSEVDKGRQDAKAGDDRNESKDAKAVSKPRHGLSDAEVSTTGKTALCRQYVTRAGVTRLQMVPCVGQHPTTNSRITASRD